MATAPIGTAWRQIQRLFVDGRVASLPDGELLERFLSEGDEAAFTALVERHGPMVLGTCRAVLRDPNAAEDAFQATFLVLICKARSIRDHGALASWLYQVAHRIAHQAGTDAARRRKHERYSGEMRAENVPRVEPEDEWREILHEEVARLTDKYRKPLLLCDLEGKTHAQAAIELKCGEATVQRRLTGARNLLRRRLIRRGVTLSVASVAAAFGRSASAAVPAAWIETTVKAAGQMSSTAARVAIGEIVSTTAEALARKLLRLMLWSQLKAGATAVVFLVALIGLAWGIGMPSQTRQMEKPRTAPATSPVRAKDEKPADPDEFITYRGRVLDPDGRPFAGAALYLIKSGPRRPDDSLARAISDTEGRFHFAVRKSTFDTEWSDKPWSGVPVLARATGYAFGLSGSRDSPSEMTLQLARDDVPVSGRIIDLEGRPVVGATVTVLMISTPAQGSLDGLLKALQERKREVEHEFISNSLSPQPDPPIIPPVKSGADGRFVIAGIGRERFATLGIQGETIEAVEVCVRTRPGETIRIPEYVGAQADEVIAIYGATFEHAAGPTRPIEGIVRDRDTRKPLAGILVQGEQSLGSLFEAVQSITDAQGHYRLVGLPRGREGYVLAVAPVDIPLEGFRKAALKVPRDEELPYLRARVAVGDSSGTGPIRLDINLKRGVWVTGRVIEEDTRKPVQALVEYFVFEDNPHLELYPAFRRSMIQPHWTRRDGVFHLVAFPGAGVLAARVLEDVYIQGAGVDTLPHKPENESFMTQPDTLSSGRHHVVAEIDPAPGTVSLNRDLQLQRGRSLTVTVLGPDGKPLTGNQVAGLRDVGYWETPSPAASTYTILSLKPGKGRTLTFLNAKQGLTGRLVLRGDETKPQTISLKPWGVLTGRVVDADGQPRNVGDELSGISLPGDYPKIGKDGRFRIEGLLPGEAYSLQILEKDLMLTDIVVMDVKVGSGEVKDLGDVLPQPIKE